MNTDPERKYSILVVDDIPHNIDILKGILAPNYSIMVAINGNMALKIAQEKQPDLILLDIMMPEMDGYEVCTQLKSNPITQGIPVIFVTAMSESDDETRGFEVGAVDYISKPVQAAVVKARVSTQLALADQQHACEQLVKLRTLELQASQKAAVFMLGEAGHYNDNDTGVHVWRMAAYSAALARDCNWPKDQVDILELAAPMHDTGKIGISDTILKAPRKLTAEEFELMKQHTSIGHSILSKSETPLFQMAAEIALSHHEKWNGSGYPHGLSGEDIPLSARIVSITDVFDALTMVRPYKQAWTINEAFDYIRQAAGEQFDPQLVTTFLALKPEIIRLKQQWDEIETENK